MPVIPHGVPPFSINPPCTAGDAGLPSDSLSNDVSRVFHLIEDERHLTAHALLLSVQTRIAEWDRTQVEATATDHKNKKQKKLNKKEKAHLAAHEKKESDRIAKLKDTLKSKEAVLVKLEVCSLTV